jgi:uncharacterized membrane protein
MSRSADDLVTDRLENTVGRVLKLGTIVSSICLGAGLVASLLGLAPGFARPLLALGLLVLLATPALRVAVSAVAYARSRDWLFVALTVIVLAELALSVIAAVHGSRAVTHI